MAVWPPTQNVAVHAAKLRRRSGACIKDCRGCGGTALAPERRRSRVRPGSLGGASRCGRGPGASGSHPEGGFGGVAAVSAQLAWAVGSIGSRPLIEHWDGTSWKVVPGPGSPRLQTLAGVAASSAKDAWAVGLGTGPGNSSLGLIRHWNGTAWS
jgi:hypothetical protein